MDGARDKGGRPNELKVRVSREDCRALEDMSAPTGSQPEQIAAMLLHVALQKYKIGVLPASEEPTATS